jgi:hypothetical protein
MVEQFQCGADTRQATTHNCNVKAGVSIHPLFPRRPGLFII